MSSTKNHKTVKLPTKIIDSKSNGDYYSSDDNTDLKNQMKRKTKGNQKAKLSMSSKDLYEKTCYSEPVYLKKVVEKNDYSNGDGDQVGGGGVTEDESDDSCPLQSLIKSIETNRAGSKSLKKKISNTLTEITKLSDTEFDRNETFSSYEDVSFQYQKSSVSSISTEFKTELNVNSSSGESAGESYKNIQQQQQQRRRVSTKANKKVRFKQVHFDLEKSGSFS
jgi:hypothetical protein